MLLINICSTSIFFFFFFNDTATTEIYTLSLHDALPIYTVEQQLPTRYVIRPDDKEESLDIVLSGNIVISETYKLEIRSNFLTDRKSTRLNSSHGYISYAVFCLKKKKNINIKKVDRM